MDLVCSRLKMRHLVLCLLERTGHWNRRLLAATLCRLRIIFVGKCVIRELEHPCFARKTQRHLLGRILQQFNAEGVVVRLQRRCKG